MISFKLIHFTHIIISFTHSYYFNNGVILRTDDASYDNPEDYTVHYGPGNGNANFEESGVSGQVQDLTGGRRLGGGGGNAAMWTVPFCGPHEKSTLMGHPLGLKFLANDIIMVFFFAHATKGLTESLLPGGSLNPLSKAVNPLLATVGGVLGPVGVFSILLLIFYAAGAFPPEIPEKTLFNGWGVVTATDIPVAWMVARFVFGDSHPAIDYLLLLAIVDDAIGLVIIAAFYPDPLHPVRPQFLVVVLLGMFNAYLLRKWHYRCPRTSNQAWWPYVVFGGIPSWVGLLESRLHPALAMAVIVPFMPGPEAKSLERLEENSKKSIKAAATAHLLAETQGLSDEQRAWVNKEGATAIANAPTSGGEIGAGMRASIVGNKVDVTLKTEVKNEEGHSTHASSTLDTFEHDIHVYVDFGMFLFSFCNAGVQITGIGALTWLIFISLVAGKTIGIFGMYRFGIHLGYPAPLGVTSMHIQMVGFIGGIGLTVALFVADAAYVNPVLQGDAKLGALLSGLVGFVAVGIGFMFDFTKSDTPEQIKEHLAAEALKGKTDTPPPGGTAWIAPATPASIDKIGV
jgi:NhaA family Na+:H+ antiporter